MKPKSFILTVIALCMSVSMIAQKDSIHFLLNPKIDSVLLEAKKQNKLIFVDGYTDWCTWCRWMDAHMSPIDSVAAFYNTHFICVKVDMEKGNGLQWARQDSVGAVYPSYYFKNSDGDVIDRHVGTFFDTVLLKAHVRAPDAHAFIAFGRTVLDPGGITFSVYEKRYNSGLMSQSQVMDYLNLRKSLGMNTDREADALIAKQKSPIDSLSWFVLRTFGDDTAQSFKYLLGHRKLFYDKYSSDTVEKVMSQKFQTALLACLRPPQDTARYHLLYYQADHLDAGFDRMLSETDLVYYRKTGNWSGYAQAAEMYVTQYVDDSDWEDLNQWAWEFCENDSIAKPADLACAVVWIKRSIRVHEDFYNVDTYACLLYKQGKLGEKGKKHLAKKETKRAIVLAKKFNATAEGKKNPIPFSSDEELLKKIKKGL